MLFLPPCPVVNLTYYLKFDSFIFSNKYTFEMALEITSGNENSASPPAKSSRKDRFDDNSRGLWLDIVLWMKTGSLRFILFLLERSEG